MKLKKLKKKSDLFCFGGNKEIVLCQISNITFNLLVKPVIPFSFKTCICCKKNTMFFNICNVAPCYAIISFTRTACQRNLIILNLTIVSILPGRVAQSVTCLATDACLTAIPGVASSIPARSHTFVEIDHEIISTVILLPSADSFKKGCCQLQAKVCARITGYPLVQACPGKSVVR